jgi:hypothetical protein
MSLDESSFYITLPSNGKQFEDNTINNFRVRLPQRLNLEGFWDVALIEAIYPHTWLNFRPTIDDKISELVIHIAVPYETETKASALYVAQIPIAIPTNYYNTPSRLINALNLAIDQKTAQEYQNYSKFVKDLYGKPSRNTFSSLARFSFDTLINRACIAITTGENIVEKLRLSPRLSYVLGFGRNKYTILDKDWVLDTETIKIRWADYPPDMRAGLYVLYVYCSIVEKQIVGDTLAPLLAKMPVSGEYDSVVHYICNQPLYIPLVRTNIDTIEIAIKDDTNNGISFQYGKVILTLHFRKRPTFL